MVLYFGWANILSDYRLSENDSDEDDTKAVNLIKQYLRDKNLLKEFSIKYVNGAALLQGTGFTNHRSKDVDDSIQLFRFIAEIAPGSFGLLYFHDDESVDYGNQFRVLRVSKGKVHYFEDEILSPFNPTVEE